MEIILNCREQIFSLKHARWWYFKMIWKLDKKMKTGTVNGAFWRYLKRYFGFGVNIWKQERFRYLIRYFVWPAEKCLKAMKLNGAFWRYLIRYFALQTKMKAMKAEWWILTLFETFARRLLGGSAIANVNQASQTSTYIYGSTCMSKMASPQQ